MPRPGRWGDGDALETLGELGRGLVTTPEQTALDLIRRGVADVTPDQLDEALRTLVPRCDPQVLTEIAAEQRLGRALQRVQGVGRLSRAADQRGLRWSLRRGGWLVSETATGIRLPPGHVVARTT